MFLCSTNIRVQSMMLSGNTRSLIVKCDTVSICTLCDFTGGKRDYRLRAVKRVRLSASENCITLSFGFFEGRRDHCTDFTFSDMPEEFVRRLSSQ